MFTVHWIDDDWKMLNMVLFTNKFSERHTAENITGQACAKWKIPDDCVMAIVHDHASNMTAAVRKLEWERLLCVAYTCNFLSMKV